MTTLDTWTDEAMEHVLEGGDPDAVRAGIRATISKALAVEFEKKYPTDFLHITLRVDQDLDVGFSQWCRTDEDFDKVKKGFVAAINYLRGQVKDFNRCPYYPPNLDERGLPRI